MSSGRSSKAERRLLEEGQRGGAMPWIIAIMLFLTVLAAAAGLGLIGAARGLDADLAGRLTVQVIEANADSRARDTARVIEVLQTRPDVRAIREVDRAELVRLLEPWLGDAGLDSELPVPTMIDVELNSGSDRTLAEIEAAVIRAAPAARVDRHERWLAPVKRLIDTLVWLAVALVLLMAAAAAAAVVLSARAGLDTHRQTIEVLHILGSTDVQIARLFQRRIALDTLFGGLIGLIAAGGVLLVLAWQIGSLGSELVSAITLGRRELIALAAMPFAFVLLATIAARLAVLGALRKIL